MIEHEHEFSPMRDCLHFVTLVPVRSVHTEPQRAAALGAQRSPPASGCTTSTQPDVITRTAARLDARILLDDVLTGAGVYQRLTLRSVLSRAFLTIGGAGRASARCSTTLRPHGVARLKPM